MKRRILIAHSFYRVAGGEDQYVSAQLELLRQHHRVMLLARHNHDLAMGPRTAARMIWSPRLTGQVAAEMTDYRPDIVHLHNVYPALGSAVHLAAVRCGVPLVMTVHNLRLRCPNGVQFTKGALCRRCEGGAYGNAVIHGCFSGRAQASAYAIGLWLHRFALRLEDQVALFVAPSTYLRDRLLAWGIAKERVVLVRNFTDLPAGASPEVGEAGLYLGRLSAEKGLAELLHALRRAGDPPFHFAGSGPLEGQLRHLAGELDLRRARFLGPLDRPRVAKALGQARYLALPSTCDENAPMAALEGLAAGRPLVVTQAGGLPELIAEGAGLVARRGDVDDLAAKIDRLATDDNLCWEAGMAALRFADRELRPEVHLRCLEGAYRKVASN